MTRAVKFAPTSNLPVVVPKFSWHFLAKEKAASLYADRPTEWVDLCLALCEDLMPYLDAEPSETVELLTGSDYDDGFA